MRGPRSAGYGFVALATEEAALKAVETLDKKELDGRSVIVEIAKPSDQKDKEKRGRSFKRRPGRRGAKAVPGEVSEAEANGEAPKDDGAVAAPESSEAAKPKKKKKKFNRKRRSAAPPTEGDATGEAAPVSESEKPAEGSSTKKPRVRKPRVPHPPRPAGEAPPGEPSKTMLFVANLGFNVEDAALGDIFTNAGITVTSARIVRRRWGQPRKSKGYGFVDVGSEEEQQKAIAALDGKDIEGRALVVKVAVNSIATEETKDGAEVVPTSAA